MLLFAAVSAVIHYNCFARPLAVLINRALGIPVLNYFDDFGVLLPGPLGAMTLWMVENTSSTLGAPMKTIKSLVDAHLAFLGILDIFRAPERTHSEHRTSTRQDREMVSDHPRSRRGWQDYVQTLRKTDRQTSFRSDLGIRPLRPRPTNTITRQTMRTTILRDPHYQGN